MLVCRVSFLDESEIKLTVNDLTNGQALFDEVCTYLNLAEKDYFGLKSECSVYKHVWVKSNKRLKHQFSQKEEDVWTFKFLAKFYPSDPSFVKEELTKYHLCLQMREDLLTKRLPCPLDTLAVLSSYWLQSEFGDNEADAKDLKQSLSSLRSILDERSISDFEPQVLKLYKSRRGMPAVDADTQFLRLACKLPLYGVHRYTAADKRGSECTVGVSSSGIVEITSKHDAVTYKWNRIKHINYKKNKFYLKILGTTTMESHSSSKSFTFDSAIQAKALWQNAVDHHVFYRTTASDKTSTASIQGSPVVDQRNKLGKKRKLSFRLSFRKKRPKTEAETREESSKLRRSNPTVVRHSSLRRSASLRSETSSSPTTSEASPTQKNELRSILKSPKVESSSEDEDDGRPYTNDDIVIEETVKVEVVKTNLLLVETIPEEDEENLEVDESATTPKEALTQFETPAKPAEVKTVPAIVHENEPTSEVVTAVQPPEVVVEATDENPELETHTNPVIKLDTSTNALGPPPLVQKRTKDALKIEFPTESSATEGIDIENTKDASESPRADSVKVKLLDNQPENPPEDIQVQSKDTLSDMNNTVRENPLDDAQNNEPQVKILEDSPTCSNQSAEANSLEVAQNSEPKSKVVEDSSGCMSQLPRAESVEANQGSEPEENLMEDDRVSTTEEDTLSPSSTETDPQQPVFQNVPSEKNKTSMKDEDDADDWKTIGASSAVAVLGDDDTDLNDVIGYEEDIITYREDRGKEDDMSQVESYSSKSPSSSISELTNNTEELCSPNILDVIWGKCLGPENKMNDVYHELFGVKLRATKGRLFRRKAKSDIFSTVEQRSIGIQVPCLPEEDESNSSRKFIPSWPFDPDSIASNSKIDELDQAAITAALQAHVECNEIRKKIESNINAKSAPSDTKDDFKDPGLPIHDDDLDFPFFAKSVALYYLHSSTEASSRRLSGTSTDETLSAPSSPVSLETPKYPPTIKRFVSASDNEEKDTREYNVDDEDKPLSQDDFTPRETTDEQMFPPEAIITTKSTNILSAEDVSVTLPEQGDSVSSGSNTPSLPSSASSTLSRSSFPRFIHSIFPLRKPSASSESERSEERGRMKQRKRKPKKSKKGDDKSNRVSPPTASIQKRMPPNENVSKISEEKNSLDQVEHQDKRTAEHFQVSDSEAEGVGAVKDDSNTSTTGSIDEIVLSDADEAHTTATKHRQTPNI